MSNKKTSNNPNVHVTKRPDGNWQAKKPGSQRALGVAKTQQGAFEIGRNHATNIGAEVSIHGQNGQIRKKHTYGKTDPRKTKG